MRPAHRFEILRRDNFTCRYCGRGAPAVELHVDHARARVNGGDNEDENLVAACVDCNLGKGGSDAEPPEDTRKTSCTRCGRFPPGRLKHWLPGPVAQGEDYCYGCCKDIEDEMIFGTVR